MFDHADKSSVQISTKHKKAETYSIAINSRFCVRSKINVFVSIATDNLYVYNQHPKIRIIQPLPLIQVAYLGQLVQA